MSKELLRKIFGPAPGFTEGTIWGDAVLATVMFGFFIVCLWVGTRWALEAMKDPDFYLGSPKLIPLIWLARIALTFVMLAALAQEWVWAYLP